ncbi:MAG: hypothetical protein ACI4SQ_03895 [Eubacterium sp.]
MKKLLKNNKKEIFFGVLLVVELLCIFIFNLTRLKCQADYDSSCGMAQIIEIWKQKTLAIKDWSYQTTVGWDVPIMFAIPLYAITKNIYFSIGFVNNLFVIGFVALFFDILKQAKVSMGYRFATMTILFAPYTLGQLGYTPMLFTGTASYALKVMVTLLMIDLMMRCEAGKKFRNMLLPMIFLCVFSVMTGISSGVYMFACGIVPIAVYIVLNAICRGDLKLLLTKKSIFVLTSTACFGAGMVISKVLNYTNSADSMTFIPAGKFATNIIKCFGGIYELFGVVSGGISPKVMSGYGIMALFAGVITSFVLYIVIYYSVRLIKKQEKRPIVCMLLCVFVVNQLILLITDTNYASESFEFRYHIVTMVPSMLLIGVFLQDIKKRVNVLVLSTICIVLFAGASFISFLNFWTYFETTKTGRVDNLMPIAEAAKKYDVNLIVDLALEGEAIYDGRILRLCDSDVNVTVYTDYNVGMGWGASSKYFENGRHTGKTMVMVPENSVDSVPSYIMSRMQLVEQMKGYNLYIVEKNIFDSISAFEDTWTKKSIDFPYSANFQVDGEINNRGELCVKPEGGTPLIGAPMTKNDGNYKVTLKYRQRGKNNEPNVKLGEFHITAADGRVLRSVDIMSGQRTAVIPEFHFEDGIEEVHYEVIANQNTRLRIASIQADYIEENK